MIIPFRNTVAGRYKIEAVARDGRRRLLADWFPNIITNGGLNRIGSNATQISACHVGTGTAVPAATDTTLGNRIATTNSATASNTVTNGTTPYYVAEQRTFRFGEGVAAGTLSEVGIGWLATSPYTLFSRALILDSGGNPTTITVLSNEFLDVTYELRHYPPLTDASGTVNISGVDYAWLSRASSAGSANWVGGSGLASGFGNAVAYNGTIGSITGTPSGTNDQISVTPASYVDSSYQRDNVISASLTQANLSGGIRSIRLTETVSGLGGPIYQIQFTPAIPKISTTQLSLTVRHSWSRASI